MSPITSLLVCKQLERTSPARIRKHSKNNSCHCFGKWVKYYFDLKFLSFFLLLLNERFVSISKNYRSVIRACMEELRQVAGENFKWFLLYIVIYYYICIIVFSDVVIHLMLFYLIYFFCSFYKRFRIGKTVWKSGLCFFVAICVPAIVCRIVIHLHPHLDRVCSRSTDYTTLCLFNNINLLRQWWCIKLSIKTVVKINK